MNEILNMTINEMPQTEFDCSCGRHHNFSVHDMSIRKGAIEDLPKMAEPFKDGKILGLNDLLEQMKKDDASAFVDDDQNQAAQNQARFTTSLSKNTPPGKMTKEDIMNIKDAGERQAAIASNMSLFE